MGKSNKIAKVGFKKDEMPIPGLNIKSKKIKKLKHNKIKKNREREILLNLNIDMSEILKKEMSKLSLENKNIDNQLQNAKIAAKMNYLSKYGRDYKNKYLEDIGDLLQNERQLSRGQRKRAEKKAKFVRKQLMHEKLVKKKKDQVKEQKKQKDGLKDKEENTAMVDGEGEIKQNITESIQGKKSKKRSNKPKNKMKGMKDIFNDMNLGVTKSIKKSKKARKLEKNNELKDDILRFKKILQVKSYRADPIKAIKEHVTNTILIQEKKELVNNQLAKAYETLSEIKSNYKQ